MAPVKKAVKKSPVKKSGPKKAAKKVSKKSVPKKAAKKTATKKSAPKRTAVLEAATLSLPMWQAYCKTEDTNIGSPTTDFNAADALAAAHKVGAASRHVVTVIASN